MVTIKSWSLFVVLQLQGERNLNLIKFYFKLIWNNVWVHILPVLKLICLTIPQSSYLRFFYSDLSVKISNLPEAHPQASRHTGQRSAQHPHPFGTCFCWVWKCRWRLDLYWREDTIDRFFEIYNRQIKHSPLIRDGTIDTPIILLSKIHFNFLIWSDLTDSGMFL